MPVFVWEGKLADGTLKKGEVDAESKASVNTILRRQRITPIKVKSKPKNIVLLKQKVRTKELVVFVRQFATMINAGLPLVQCLEILGTQQANAEFKRIITTIRQDVEGGSTFADALKKHPQVFDDLFINLVAAGELGGVLDIILNRLALHMEKSEAIKGKVKSAMVYPIIVICVAVVVVAILMIFVIPTFKEMFTSFGGSLPAPTQMVISMSNFFRGYWWVMIIIIVALLAAFRYAMKVPKIRYQVDKVFLKLPLFGPLLRKVAVAKFSRTLSTMISSGVPIMDGLEITSKSSGNLVIEEGIKNVRQAISEGKPMADPLEATGLFPGMVVQMVSVGEATGALDNMLAKIADFYDEEVDAAVSALTASLEPMLMVFLGGTIGFLVVAMYLPIFKMGAVVG
ncbi:MAG TPA: type II secretion system F family protein [Desulfomonilia bacterium]